MKTKTAQAILAAAVIAAACGRQAEPARGAATASPAGQAPAAAPAVKVTADNPCSVLLPQEVEQILGANVPGREIVDEVTCSFPFEAPKGASAAGGGDASGAPKAPANDREAEAMAKSLASAFAGGPPQLVVKVYRKDAKMQLAATRLANSFIGSFEAVPDIGDEAWLGPMASTLVFRKGDVAVELDLRMVPDARDKGIRLAKLIASRL